MEEFFTGNPIDCASSARCARRAVPGPAGRVDPAGRAGTEHNLVWLRADGELPDDPLLHVCLMTYASDMTLLDSVLRRHGLSWADGKTVGASLDHAMWFHRPVPGRPVAAVRPGVAVARRGPAGWPGARSSPRAGELVVSVVQEGLIRPVRDPAARRP